MKSQTKIYTELKEYCDLARAIPPKSWTTHPPISQVPPIKDYHGAREDVPFLNFWENITELKANHESQTFAFSRRIITKGHMYLYPAEEVGITITGKSDYGFSAIHRSDSFADRFYTEISGTINDILSTIFDPIYVTGFRKYNNMLIDELKRESS